MKTVFWGNCQSLGVEHFLRKSGFPSEIQSFRNFMVILKEEPFEAVIEATKKCDLLLVQPTDPHKETHERTRLLINEALPKSARVLFWQPVACHAYFPLVPMGGKTAVTAPYDYFGADDIKPFLMAHTLAETLEAYDAHRMEFRCRWRLHASVAEQRRREENCDVRVADYMFKNPHRRLFLSQNHPTSRIMAEMARQVWKLALDRDVQPEWTCDNEINLPCSEPLSQYVINEMAMDGYVANPLAHARFREFVHGAWNMAHGEPAPLFPAYPLNE